MSTPLSPGMVHDLPDDLTTALTADALLAPLWERLAPLGRNEFLCWPGCIHRTDKPPSRWQQAVLINGKR